MLERLKSMLLAVLAVLAVFLFIRIWQGETALLDAPPAAPSEEAPLLRELHPAALPAVLSDCRNGIRRGSLWDGPATAQAMPLLGPSLGEALGSAGTPSPAAAADWEAALTRDGVYLLYTSAVPLQALGAWYSADSPLEASARRILLSERDGLWDILYEDGAGRYFRCATAAPAQWPELSLPEVCRFAFQEPDKTGQGLHPLTLLPEAERKPPVLEVSVPPLTEPAQALLRALKIDPATPFQNQEADGTAVYVDYRRQCTISPGGLITYSDPAPEDTPILAAAEPSETGAIESALALCQTLQTDLGQGVWELRGVTALPGGGTELLYGVQAGGYPVLGSRAAYARFILREGRLIEMTALVKHYTLTEGGGGRLPLKQALAALKTPDTELFMAFLDEGGAVLDGRWVYRAED